MSKNVKTEEFIEKAILVHGDKYDYSKVEYIGAFKNICIICPIHGEFYQTPSNHLSGKGCLECSGKKQLTTESFINKARLVHSDKYDYSKVNYIGANDNVCIICPIHGEFLQRAYGHLIGKGCSKCSHVAIGLKERKLLSEFIKKAKEVHRNKYDYSKVEYINAKTKVCIICPEHGEFWQRAYGHLSGKGCLKCSGRYKITTEEFIEKAKEVHGDKYDYSKVEYVNNGTKVCIICPEHGEFWQKPMKHINVSQGCPKCNESKLEIELGLFLSNNNIEFEAQKKFDWLGRQSLDFYVPQFNVGIECQGEQHFEAVDHFGGEEVFKLTNERDLNKKQLCEENGIKLLYFSNLHIVYPYLVYEDKEELLKEIQLKMVDS